MREMKNSGIEWIGDIPAAWKLKKGKFLFAQRNEKGNSITLQLLSPTQKYGVIPQSLYEELSGMKAVKLSEDVSLTDFKSIYSGDFCISLRSFQGGFEYSQYNGVVSPAYQVFYKTTEDTFDGFYRYMFKEQGFIAYMTSFTKTFRDGKSISFLDFSNSLLPLPPFAEQKKIAEFLDHQCAEIDAVIAKTKETIEEYKKLKQSIITEAVTKGIRGERPMKDSGIEWVGDVPVEWDVSILKRYCRFKTGATPSTTNSEWFEGDLNWFTPGDFSDNYYLIDSQRKLSDNAKTDGVAVIIPNNTVVIVGIGGTAGKIGLTTNECSCNQQITALIAESVHYKYLMYWMVANAKYLKDTALYTTLPILNNETIGEYLFILPTSKIEQKEIADYLDKKCAEIDTLIAKKTALLAEMESYKKSVIYEYVTGKKEVTV